MGTEINLTRSEAWHIVQVMKDRGTSHCQECQNIHDKLKEWIEESDSQN